MTISARAVLEDCRGSVQELANGVQGPIWRRRWITSVVLLRAVGHVLHNVDGQCSAAYRKEIDSWWQELKNAKPKPEIFWKFIEEERNTILKEYEINAGQGVTVFPGMVTINLKTGAQTSDPPAPSIFHYTINAGHFKGRDQRDLINEAIDWWQDQLDAIDESVMQSP